VAAAEELRCGPQPIAVASARLGVAAMTETRSTEPADPAPAAEVLRLATAYQASRATYVAAKLGVPDLLADGPKSAEDLAAATGAHASSLRRLMRALAGFGVLAEGGDGRFALGALGGVPARRRAWLRPRPGPDVRR
jgi:Dimerisation domain